MMKALILGLIVVVLPAGCGGNLAVSSPTPTAIAVEVEVGGMSLTGDSPDGAAAAESRGVTSEDEDSTALSVEAVLLETGNRVSALGKIRILDDASPQAGAMAEYPAGATFRVVEPGGDFVTYPVEINGVRWYRVRAEDGLVGWIMADGVEPIPSED